MTDAETADSSATQEDAPTQTRTTDPGIVRLVQEHPVAALAGGLAIGAVAAALLPRRNRKHVSEKSSALADAIGAAGLMLFREAIERAEAASDGVRGIAGRFGRSGSEKAATGADAVSDEADVAGGLAGLIRNLPWRQRH